MHRAMGSWGHISKFSPRKRIEKVSVNYILETLTTDSLPKRVFLVYIFSYVHLICHTVSVCM